MMICEAGGMLKVVQIYMVFAICGNVLKLVVILSHPL